MNTLPEVNESDFDKEVLGTSIPTVVDFWAPWCKPCLALTPLLEETAKQFDGSVKVVKVNVDNNSALATRYGIRSIPSLVMFKNGVIFHQEVGLLNKSQLEAFFRNGL